MTYFSRDTTGKKGTQMSDREHTSRSGHKIVTHLAGFRGAPLEAAPSARGRRLPSAARIQLAAVMLVLALTALFASAASASAASVEMISVSEASYTSAKATGKVLTNELAFGTSYTFEYCPAGLDCTEDTNWSPGPSNFSGVAETKPVQVTGKLEGLKGGTKYSVRLKTGGGSVSPEPNPSFTTLTADPTSVVTIDNASEVAYTTARATGKIKRPANSDNVACHFEYITDQQFDENVGNSAPGFQGAGSAGCEPEESVSTIGNEVPVGAKLKELANATTYHLRLVVSNADSSDAKEAASTFTTLTVDPPSVVSIENASGVEYSQAQVKGVVERPANPDHAFDVTCNFEYITDAQFKENEEVLSQPGFTGAGQVACEPEAEPAENPITVAGQRPVKATLPGLTASTTYHLRLSATNLGGSDSKEAAATFTTEGPVPPPVVVSIEEASEVTIHTATAEGVVERPAGKDPALDLNCRFEYISDAQFQANPPGEEFAGAGQAGCIQNPITEGTVGPDGTEAVKAELGSLRADTTFHLRLVAENGVGGTDTKEAPGTFTTLPPELPTISIDPITEEVFTTAHISGTIGEGQGSGRLLGYFEMSSDGGASWSQIQLVDAVGEHVYTGLQPETTYLFRLSGWHDHGFGFGPQPFELGEVAFSATETITTQPLAAPTAVLDPVTAITATGAHFSGTVDTHAPVGPLGAAAKAAYKTEWRLECTPGCKDRNGHVIGGTVAAEEGVQPVAADVEGLDPNTHYQVKLIAENELKAPVESQQTFDTPLVKPTVTALPGGSDGEGGYTLAGIVNPNNSPVSNCEFKWGPNSAAYAFSAPCSPPPGAGARPVTVEAHLTGLTPGATYHFDLVAANGAPGNSESGDHTFVPTLAVKGPTCPNEQLRAENGSLGLPECRAYEQVTNPNKEGYSALFGDFDGGDALAYTSEAANINGSGLGELAANSYVATRTAAGWETIANLNGPQGSMFSPPESLIPAPPPALALYSADLRTSIWAAKQQGGDEPRSVLLLRSPDGSFVRVGKQAADAVYTPSGGAGTGGAPFALRISVVGASADLSHLVVNGGSKLWATYWGPGVYEFLGTGNDLPRRVDLDNSGEPIASFCPGNPQEWLQRAAEGKAVSTDGRVIVFSVPGGCGAGPPAGEIWVRVNGNTSYDASASQCDRVAPACNAPADATFVDSTLDGSRVYFTTTQQLVNGDTDQTNDLYACDIPPGTPTPSADPANPCTALHEVSAGSAGKADVQKILTVSDDGSTAYFTAKGVLADNEDALKEKALPGDENLYVWRTDASHPEGQITFVARLPEGGGNVAQTTPDGRYLVLQTAGRLLASDTDEATDIYRYDTDTGETVRVSTAVSGAGGNGELDAKLISLGSFTSPKHDSHPSISDNGKLIVFATEEQLSPLDGNGAPDAYLWNDGHVLGSVAPLLTASPGTAQEASGLAYIDGSGQDVYVQTATRLTATDIDTGADVYDVRVDGGFAQHQEGCVGETCQPPASNPPATSTSPANRANGEGNLKPKACPKGKVVKGKKCVKKHQKKHKAKHHKKGHKKHGSHKHKRTGSNNGGGK